MNLVLQYVILVLAVCISIVNSQTWDPITFCPTCPANTDDKTNFDALNKVNTVLPPENIPPCGRGTASCFSNIRFRRIDGSCNNLMFPTWGQANTTYSRLLPPAYNDGISTPRMATDHTPLSGARSIRAEMFPAGSQENPTRNINAILWGQFVTHDMSNLMAPQQDIRCCSSTGQQQTSMSNMCFPIGVSANDRTQGAVGIRCMNFTRTVTDKDLGCSFYQPALPINSVTSYMDLSNVYSNDDGMSRSLRNLTGGLLKVEVRNNRTFPPTESDIAQNCPCNAPGESVCYRTGDARTNQNLHLTILQILFHREHNRLANGLKALNPLWDDERLFQEARRINIAQFQFITYYEWMPVMLGNTLASKGITFPTATGFVNDYNNAVKPDVSNEHAHAAFRYFHTHIAGIIRQMNEQRAVTSTVSLDAWILRPGILEQSNGNSIDEFTVGMLTQPGETTDNIFVQQMVDKLFACQGIGFGADLKALDIQRDRDHGLAYYNDYRNVCGLRNANSFDDFNDVLGSVTIQLLKKYYKNFRDVDLSVAGSLETLAPGGAQVGQTFHCIITEQFKRTRQADRYFFENSGSGFTLDQLKEIKKATVARLFCDNGNGISRIQRNAFFTVAANGGTLDPCSSIPSIDLTKWREDFFTWLLGVIFG